MVDPRIGKLVKKNGMDVPKVEKVEEVGGLVKRIETGGPQATNIVRKIQDGGSEIWRVGEEDPDE